MYICWVTVARGGVRCTVFRDQEFSADVGDRNVKRIDDVQILRSAQFLEDAGPMAHPIRPDSPGESRRELMAVLTRSAVPAGSWVPSSRGCSHEGPGPSDCGGFREP